MPRPTCRQPMLTDGAGVHAPTYPPARPHMHPPAHLRTHTHTHACTRSPHPLSRPPPGKEGQYEQEGYGQRPYDNWERIMFDARGQVSRFRSGSGSERGGMCSCRARVLAHG